MNYLRMKKTCVLKHNYPFKYKISTTGIFFKKAKLYEKIKAKIKKDREQKSTFKLPDIEFIICRHQDKYACNT